MKAPDAPELRAIDLSFVVIATLVTAMLLGSVIAVLVKDLTTSQTFFYGGLAFYVPAVISGWYFVIGRGRATWSQIGLGPVKARVLALMVPLTLGMVVVANVVTVLVSELAGANAEDIPGTPTPANGLDTFLLLVAVVLLAPFAEELFFRGLLHTYLRKHMRRLPATLISSAAFGVAHIHPLVIAGLFITGIVLAVVKDQTGSLWSAIVLHALFNATAVAVTLLQGTV